jgi:peptidoglycan/LPS O-acetylase OafA/YrhL
MRYSPPLDGIRAVAILAVLIFHISPTTLSGGFTGVDVFFVLSGFLITSIILNDFRKGCFSLREFYLRRVQRLLPNVIVTVLAVLLLWTIFMPPGAAHQAAHHGIWALFNLSNFYILKDLGGYWGSAAEWSPLTHTWSLGIEEQFYLLFPGSLLLLAHYQSRRIRSWIIVVTLFSFALCLYGTHTHPAAAFYLLPTRVWELLIGAALSTQITLLRKEETLPTLGVTTQELIGVVGLGMIILGFIFINGGSGFPGMVSLVPTVGTGLVLLSVKDEKTKLSQLLSSSFMVKTGQLSYSIYLWHWPLITLGKALAILHGKPQIYGSISGGILGILLAWCAYVGVEQPLRHRGPGRTRRFIIIAVGFLIAVLSCVAVMSRRPVADPSHRFDTPAFWGEEYAAGNSQLATNEATQSTRYYDVYFPPIPSNRPTDLWRTGGVIHLYGGGHPEVVVLGSSHALMYSKLIDDLCRKMDISVAFLGVDSTPVFFDTTSNFNFSSPLEASEFDQAREKWLKEWHPNVVFLIDRWDGQFSGSKEFGKKLRSLLMEVSPMAKHVIFVSQVPAIGGNDQYNLRELVSWHMKHEDSLPLLYPDLNEPLRKQAVELANSDIASFPNLSVLRVDSPFYKEDGSIRYASGRAFFYADEDHLSEAGAEVVRGVFQSAIVETNLSSSNQSTKMRFSGGPLCAKPISEHRTSMF